MFTLRRYPLISSEMSKYIKDSTNKSLENYTNNFKFVIHDKTVPLSFFVLFPFVSLISFLAGYNYCKLIT
jgi:hypothetical protein